MDLQRSTLGQKRKYVAAHYTSSNNGSNNTSAIPQAIIRGGFISGSGSPQGKPSELAGGFGLPKYHLHSQGVIISSLQRYLDLRVEVMQHLDQHRTGIITILSRILKHH